MSDPILPRSSGSAPPDASAPLSSAAAVRATLLVVAVVLAVVAGASMRDAGQRGGWGDGSHATPPLRIDLNRADATELATLPGIGPALADRIVTDRTRNGPFATVDDLERVRGIGPRTVERLAAVVAAGVAPGVETARTREAGVTNAE